MTRLEAEKRMLKKLAEIVAIYHEYNPAGQYLSLSYIEGHLSIDNANNGVKRIDTWLDAKWIKHDPSPWRSNETFKPLNQKDRQFFHEKIIGG